MENKRYSEEQIIGIPRRRAESLTQSEILALDPAIDDGTHHEVAGKM